MKERPILFSAPMVRAILDGRKTQTRRIIKPQPEAWAEAVDMAPYKGYGTEGTAIQRTLDDERQAGLTKVPYGKPGDRLWVREKFARISVAPIVETIDDPWFVYAVEDNRTDYGGPWKPSIHMPRAACRIELEVTAVRAERLQDISEADARAEGAYVAPKSGRIADSYAAMALAGDWFTTGCGWYKDLWGRINGADRWDANPWVWVVEFKRAQP